MAVPMIKLYNSLTRTKQEFIPIENKKVKIYVCGITPYDTTHLGHAFVYIIFDVLVRLLRFKNYNVKYTQNVTDINDRDNDILKRAKEQNISWKKLADYWTKIFLNDMKKLNWIMPNYYLKASENIKPMINIIEKLLINGFAYKINNSVYFDISKKKDFGKLSKISRKEMLKIAKNFEEDIENKDKKNPLDITLWRKTSKNQAVHIPFFESPFGQGRPGWHIECSAMSLASLGNQIDIHGGGSDLMYPHHEAEIAQSEGATGKTPFAKYWMHIAQVSYKGDKMSKSLGNVVMVSDLLKKYTPNEIRWMLLSHHYRIPWEFKKSELEITKKNLDLVIKSIKLGSKEECEENNDYFKEFLFLLEDDLNTPKALDLILKLSEKKDTKKTVSKCLNLLGFIL